VKVTGRHLSHDAREVAGDVAALGLIHLFNGDVPVGKTGK